jgi:hypothetical protein
MLTRFLKMAALAVPLLAAAGCANMSRAPTYGLEPGGAALVRQACTDVMGIRSGFAEFEACADSLSETVRALNDGRLITQASAHCEREGHSSGTVELAKCVVLTKETLDPDSSGLAPLLTSNGPPSRSYWSVSLSQQSQRMELSCAHLGLHPASAGFGKCVANLRNALLMLQNPLPL